MDVYERPWMAPRAGFEVSRKQLVQKGVALAYTHRTPGDTPPSMRCISRVGVIIDPGSRTVNRHLTHPLRVKRAPLLRYAGITEL